MTAESKRLVVAGVDVGGNRKGFHAVALENGAYRERFSSNQAAEIAAWCHQIGARCVGIDAPCRWSADRRARVAERQLMKERISCFSTPSQEVADSHPKDHFRWMLNGAAMFSELQVSHTLFTGHAPGREELMCFETFPQAVACALAGKSVSAKEKGTIRRDLLSKAGVDIRSLTNIDFVDAALCAVTADLLAQGNFKMYGEPVSGFIVVPGNAASRANSKPLPPN